MPRNIDIELKENFSDIKNRHVKLLEAKRGCLIWTSLPEETRIAETCLKVPALEDINFRSSPLLLSQMTCERIEKMWNYRKKYRDDSLPCVSPRFGSGIIAGMITGNLTFSSNTSWITEIKKTLDDVINFTWGKENEWFDLVLSNLNYAAQRMKGKAFCALEGYHSPLEFASIIRGSDLYLDIYTAPEKVHQLLKNSKKALLWLYKKIDMNFYHYNPGVLAYHMWLDKGLNFLSDDAAGLISAEHYREFGLPYTDSILEYYCGGFLHVHTQAYHQIDNLRNMKSLTLYNWRQDPNSIKPVEILVDIAEKSGKIVSIYMTPNEIKANINILAKGRFIILTDCQDLKEQNTIIDLINNKAPIE